MAQKKISVNVERHVVADVILEKKYPVCNLLEVGWATGSACKQ